jgi:hypothetical protein
MNLEEQAVKMWIEQFQDWSTDGFATCTAEHLRYIIGD